MRWSISVHNGLRYILVSAFFGNPNPVHVIDLSLVIERSAALRWDPCSAAHQLRPATPISLARAITVLPRRRPTLLEPLDSGSEAPAAREMLGNQRTWSLSGHHTQHNLHDALS